MAVEPTPRSVATYGLLGLIPFLAPPVVALARPDLKPLAGQVQALYGGLILSFLGGVRWGFAVQTPAPDATTISLSMLPTIASLAILTLLGHAPRLELLALAGALLAHCAWDLTVSAAPAWFARIRTILTMGAAAGLFAGAWAAG
jgi:hypothetical protein